MRTLSASQQAIWNSGSQSEFVRVSIKDSGGTFRDLTTYPGFNAQKAVTWSEKIDNPHMTCEVILHREMYRYSLSPFVSNSAINKGFNPLAASSPLIALNREVMIEVSIAPYGRAPTEWMEVFRGRVDTLDAAQGYDVRLSCRSLAGRMAQQFIKTELVYSYASVSGVSKALRIWEPNINVTNGVTYLLPASRGDNDPGLNKFFVCSQTGLTGNTEPVWTTGTNIVDGTARWNYVGAPTTAGTPVEQVMQAIMLGNKSSGDPTVTLYTPTSPSWAIRQFIQQREFVLDAVLSLAKQIGWDVRYKWRAGTSQFEFTFYQPERSSPSVNFTFGVGDYSDPTRMAIDIANIRNSWRIVYSDRNDTWPDGTPKRKTIEVTNPTSITKYGELWAEIQEAQASQVDTSTEATALVNAALSDCAEPTAEFSTTLTRGFPWVEVNDYNTFTSNGRNYDSDQSFAVTGWTQTHDGKSLKTTLELRGVPTTGAQRWIDTTVHPTNYPPTKPEKMVNFNGNKTVSASVRESVGGVTLQFQEDKDKVHLLQDYEVHLYPTSGTTLGPSTLKAVVKDKFFEAGDLIPNKMYYGKVVPRWTEDNRLMRGQPTAEFSGRAGRAKSGHIDSAVRFGPPNGNFQNISELTPNPENTPAPPDHVSLSTRVWGATADVFFGTETNYGNYLVLRQTSTSAIVNFDISPIGQAGARRGTIVSTVRPQGTLSSGRDLQFHISFYTDPAGMNEIGNTDIVCPYNIAAANNWAQFRASYSIPAGTLYVRTQVYKATTSSAYGFDIADVSLGVLAEDASFIEPVSLVASGVGFNTGWQNVGGVSEVAGYYKDPFGRVYIRGAVNRASGTNALIFTLPTGYRPSAYEFFAVQANSAYGGVEIQPSGQVRFGTGNPSLYVSLCGISFRAA